MQLGAFRLGKEDRVTDNKAKAAELLRSAPNVWDMIVPWVEFYWSFDVLRRYLDHGYTFASLTTQDMPATFEGVQKEVAEFRRRCEPHSDWLCFGTTLAEIDEGKAQGKLVLGFNVQDTELVHDDFDRLNVLKSIGVRHMLLAYQTRNRAADGCAEEADAGLSMLGRDLVAKMNEVGMVVDASHTGKRSSLDAIEISETPVIFSHSGVKVICKHIRNIDDEQIKACAKRGGVIGLVGIGAFLGEPAATAESLFRHVDHVVQLVGPEHAGIGTDFINDMTPTWAGIAEDKTGAWRDPYGSQLYEGVAFAPEQLVELVELMLNHGYDEAAIYGILGDNFRGIYRLVEDRFVSTLEPAPVS